MFVLATWFTANCNYNDIIHSLLLLPASFDKRPNIGTQSNCRVPLRDEVTKNHSSIGVYIHLQE